RVEIRAEVHPQRLIRWIVSNKFLAVEIADEVLSRGTLGWAAVANTHYEDPFLPPSGILKREEVRTLPIGHVRCARRSKFASQIPRLQIARRIKTNAMRFSHGYDHDPTRPRCIPENLGIAKFGLMNVENRISRIFRPGMPRIRTVGNILVLQTGTISGVNGNQGWDAMPAESARVLPIH